MKCPFCGSSDLRNKGLKGINRDKREFRCRECDKYFKVKVVKEEKVVLEVKETNVTGWRDLTQLAKEHQRIRKNLDFSQTTVNIKINTKEDGIVLLPIGDIHFGGEGVDYLAIEKLTDYIKENNVYIILMGDELDFFLSNFKNASALFQQLLNPEEQLVLIESWMNEIEPYLLACGWGNHTESRLESLLGVNLYGRMKSKICPYLDGMGKIRLEINKQLYEIVINHQGTGKNKYNPNHGAFDMARNKVDGDVFLSAHYHNAAFSNFIIREKPVVAIQTGTFNTSDKFSMRRYRFGEGDTSTPALFIYADKKRVLPFENVEDAVTFRNKKAL